MAKKNERELKVCAQSGYNYKSVPAIRLMGQWLETAGFHIGDPILVKCEDGKLIISLDTARAELIEAEKAFMEKETRKLHERFLKEKKELHAQFVAERQAEYAKDQERGEGLCLMRKTFLLWIQSISLSSSQMPLM